MRRAPRGPGNADADDPVALAGLTFGLFQPAPDWPLLRERCLRVSILRTLTHLGEEDGVRVG